MKNMYKEKQHTFTYIDGDEMNLRMAMLTGLRSGHVHNLAGTA
jgi:hypothetical protein